MTCLSRLNKSNDRRVIVIIDKGSVVDIQFTVLPGFVVYLNTSLHVLKHVKAQ